MMPRCFVSGQAVDGGQGHGPNTRFHLTPWAARLTTICRIERLCES